MNPTRLLPVLLLAGLLACRTSHVVTNQAYNRISVDSTARPDTSLVRLLSPYKQGLDKTMNEVLAQTPERLDKRKPECALNNLLCDALLSQATVRYGKPIDVSHLNFGGVRNGLPKGDITVGNVFEVMPFDNQLVVLTLTGDQLMRFLNHFAGDEALLVSGIAVKLRENKIQSVTFASGRTLQPAETYAVALSDYIANGGGGASFLKEATKREDLDYLIRDALIDYFRKQGRSGQPLTLQDNGRITIE
ncbi:MAG: 5'-nucleotidase C-terminal domain-containing protein [Bacteroidetes bacterium]|nr:5'-nucleotidase C-terminal domain-containing protein [Fibrella sp.]